jgi:hypothetical protein
LLVGTLLACLAAATAALLPQGRTSNVDLRVEGISNTFLMLSKTRPERGYLVDRRDSTVRRSRKNFPGSSYRVTRSAGEAVPGHLPHWLLRSKRLGTVLLVPVEVVADRSLPFAYDFVRRERPELDLPRVRWTQLHVNRVYRGLYLRVELPRDPRKRDGRQGPLRELFLVRGDELRCVDTRFDPAARRQVEAIAAGRFPSLDPPDPVLAWLSLRASDGGMTFLLSGEEPGTLTALPLPLSLSDEAERHLATLPVTRDERHRRWTQAVESAAPQAERLPFDGEPRERFEREAVVHAEALGRALSIHELIIGSELRSASRQVPSVTP